MSKSKGKSINTDIKVQVFPAKTLLFREGAGEAAADGKTWELSTQVSDNSPIVRLPDGRWVTFGWKDLVNAANQAGELASKKPPRLPIPEQPLDSIGE